MSYIWSKDISVSCLICGGHTCLRDSCKIKYISHLPISFLTCRLVKKNQELFNNITHGGFYICINLGILSLCTELWNGTRSMRISPYVCLDSQAFWWIDGVYRYWLWIHTHLSTTFILTLKCPLILTHAKRSDQYCRA